LLNLKYQAVLPQLPLGREWQISLSAGEQLLRPGDSDALPLEVPTRLFCACGKRLTCRGGDTGQRRWQVVLPFQPTWAGRSSDIVVVAGREGICSRRVEDGELLWQFVPPLAPLSKDRHGLTAFTVSAGRLFFLQDGCRLFALEAETGYVYWSCWAPGARSPFSLPRGGFNPRYLATPDRLVIQTSAGHRWLLDSRTGDTISKAEKPDEPWAYPPLALAGGRVGVVRSPRLASALDPDSGKELWTHTIDGISTLSGEPPQLASRNGTLMLVIARNYGYALKRLDPQTGKSLWPREVTIGTETIAAEHLAGDDTAVYFVNRNLLRAHDLRSGKLLWETPLTGPPGRWRVVPAGAQLLAFPSDARTAQFRFRWLFSSVQWVITHPLEEQPGFGLPLVFCDPKTGQLVQRLNLSGMERAAKFQTTTGPGLAVVPSLASMRPAREESSPVVQFAPHRLVAAVGGQVWGFQTAAKTASD